MLNVILPSVIMLIGIMLSAIILCVVTKSVLKLSNNIMSVVLSVINLYQNAECDYAKCHYAQCHYTECCGTIISRDRFNQPSTTNI